MLRIFSKGLFILGALILDFGCSKSKDNQACEVLSPTLSEKNICLTIEHNGLTNATKNKIISSISTGLGTINSLMPIDNVTIRIVDNPQLVIPEIGIGGYNPGTQEVILAINANFNDLEATLDENLIPQLAHELHHTIRRRSVGYGSTLLQGVVSEGLADHFSIEVTGIAPPPWSVALTGNDLQDWIDTASASWDQPYNHGAWFLGTNPGIPKWTGYAIGFELVKNYLLSNPDKSPSNLHSEPADSFKP